MKKKDLVTPCYIFDEKELVHNIDCFHTKLDKYFSSHIIGYSFKTNSLPRLLQIVKEQECYAEVVSEDEFRLAIKLGFPYQKIIYNGPIKSKKTFAEAVEKGSIVNIDSKREIQWLKELSFPQRPHVGIRVNFDLEKRIPKQTLTGGNGGRFGFCYENGELKEAISRVSEVAVIDGIHMHVSSLSKSIDVFKELALMASAIIDEENLELEYIDFGGGYFGGADDGEGYEKYIELIYDELSRKKKENLCIIVEPGASVVATAFSYLSRVIDTKETTYGKFVITDGTRLDVDPFFAREKYKYNLTVNNHIRTANQIICGYTCMENDRIMVINDEALLSAGDLIEYKTVGSYTLGFNNMFISFLSNVYSKDGEEYILIREKWDAEDYIRKNKWVL